MGWIAVVLNPSSGRGETAKVAGRLRELFEAAGREARIVVARAGDELRPAVLRAVEDGCAAVVAGGGDGTISAVAEVLVDKAIPLGVLPLGTLNHFAKDLGIPLDLEQATSVILDGTVCQVDTGEVNGRFFLNNSSLGVYPAIVRLRERYRAALRGKWIAAFWAALTVVRRHPFMLVRIQVEAEAVVRSTPLVLIANNEYCMAGLQAGTRDSLSRGMLAVYVLNAERRHGLLWLALRVLLRGAETVKELDLFAVEEAAVETLRSRPQLALDGEVITLASPLHYRIRPASLTVYVPAAATACYPHPAGPSSSR